jgi:hypothetical protein
MTEQENTISSPRKKIEHTYFDDYIRLVHPMTGNFIGEFYPDDSLLIVTKNRQTATINLSLVALEFYNEKSATIDDDL